MRQQRYLRFRMVHRQPRQRRGPRHRSSYNRRRRQRHHATLRRQSLQHTGRIRSRHLNRRPSSGPTKLGRNLILHTINIRRMPRRHGNTSIRSQASQPRGRRRTPSVHQLPTLQLFRRLIVSIVRQGNSLQGIVRRILRRRIRQRRQRRQSGNANSRRQRRITRIQANNRFSMLRRINRNPPPFGRTLLRRRRTLFRGSSIHHFLNSVRHTIRQGTGIDHTRHQHVISTVTRRASSIAITLRRASSTLLIHKHRFNRSINTLGNGHRFNITRTFSITTRRRALLFRPSFATSLYHGWFIVTNRRFRHSTIFNRHARN